MSSLRLTLMLGVAAVLSACALDIPTNIPRDGGPDRPDLGACGTEGLRCCTGTYDMDAGATCMGALACVSGRCTACPAGQTLCNGVCVALNTTDNCGACGTRCDNGFTCDPMTSVGMDGGVRVDAGAGDAGVSYACQVLCRAPTPTRCGTACTSTDTDSMNCGACGRVCSFSNAVGACRGGACQQVACTTGFADCDMSAANGCEVQVNGSDANNCGMCSNRCTFPHAAATCAAGACRMGACEAGYADCDMNPANGCEVQTNGADLNNCGRCGMTCPAAPTGSSSVCRMGVCGFSSVVCPSGVGNCDGMDGNGCETNLLSSVTHCSACGRACNGTNGTPSCLGGVCQIACASGFGNCDGMAANGCEINTNTNPANCGACNRACTLLHATPTCAAGACQVGTCDTGFLNCDMNPANGCEVNQNTDTGNCGACGRACLTGQSCVAGVCTFICPTGQTACGASCFNLQSDPANCGSCGRVCPAPTGTTASCTAGVCGVRIVGCPTGTADCNGNAADGCEATDVNTNPARCGATCAVCNGTNGTATCAAGACGVTCATGFANCDGLASNGCETPTTTVGNCGTCGNACNLFASTEACTSMSCTIASCDSGFLNCDGSVGNGCEVDGRNNNANCGMCGRACTVSGQACSSGTCQCPAGQTVCTSTCRDLQTDRSNCGTCGNVCPSGQVCSSGLCRTSCPSGQMDCSGACRDLTADRNNCGTCGMVCPAGQICSGSACVTSCTTGLTACGASCRDLTSDASNCGSCGNACPSGQTCVSRVCTLVCPAGQFNCSGVCRDRTSDVNNCGTCGNMCSGGQVCSASVCTTTCGSGLSNCSGSCTNTSTDPRNCNACGMVCATRTNATSTCSGGACGFACSTGFADCNATATDGCEINIQSDVANCGSCRNACSLSNAVPACVSGACAVASCNTGFANCNSMAGDGCEVDTRTSNTHCGMCGRACAAGTTCVASACTACGAAGQPACGGTMCNAGLTNCSGTCRATSTDLANCGGCGTICAAMQNCVSGSCTGCGGVGQAACTSGAPCGAGLTSCGGTCRNLTNDVSNCSVCSMVCPSGANSTPTCVTSACGLTCTGGFLNCDANSANGCESNPNTDDANCGGCAGAGGVACAGRTICNLGACVGCGTVGVAACRSTSPACDTPLVNCSGTCQVSC